MNHKKTASIGEQLNYFNYKPQTVSLPGSDNSSGGGNSRPASIYSKVTSPLGSVYSPNESSSTYNGTGSENYGNPAAYDEPQDHSKIILPASDPRSPYHISLPYQTTQPTEELSKRFAIWKKIIKQLIFYFKELAMLRQHYYQLNVHMLQNIQFLSLNNKNNPKRTQHLQQPGHLTPSQTVSESHHNNLHLQSPQLYVLLLLLLLSSTVLPHMVSPHHQRAASSSSLPSLTGSSLLQLLLLQLLAHSQGLPANDIFFGTSEDKFINSSFLPTTSKSVQGLPATLYNYHKSLSERELQTYNELSLKIIPRLENLKKSLNFKIKEIMNLKNDFKFLPLRSEVARTGQILNNYMNSIEYLEKGFVSNSSSDEKFKISGKNDPYLLKIQLDLQLKRQLLEENYLKEAFNNLQQSGLELEKIIYKELQTAMSKFSRLINQELQAVQTSLIDDLQQNFLQNEPSIDWNYYMHNDNGRNFLDSELKKKFRKLSDISYPYQKKLMSSTLRAGFMSKKNKMTKTYSKFYYVLTSNYMHEFKTLDRQKEQVPIQSLNLNHCTVVEHKELKIILQYINREKSKITFVFKCYDLKELHKWVNDLKELTSFKNSIERNKYLEMKFQSILQQGGAGSVAASSISSNTTSNTTASASSTNSSYNTPLSPQNSSLSIKFVPRHGKSSSMTSLKDQANSSTTSSASSMSSVLNRQPSSTSLSRVMIQPVHLQPAADENPGKFTANLNLSTNNLVPSVTITEHSPITLHSSGSSILDSVTNNSTPTLSLGMSENRNVDYFTIKPVSSSSESPAPTVPASSPTPPGVAGSSGLTMNIDKKLPFQSGTRTPPRASSATQLLPKKTKNQFKLNLPSSNLNELMINDLLNSIKTPGELPTSSIGDIIHGFQGQPEIQNRLEGSQGQNQ